MLQQAFHEETKGSHLHGLPKASSSSRAVVAEGGTKVTQHRVAAAHKHEVVCVDIAVTHTLAVEVFQGAGKTLAYADSLAAAVGDVSRPPTQQTIHAYAPVCEYNGNAAKETV